MRTEGYNENHNKKNKHNHYNCIIASNNTMNGSIIIAHCGYHAYTPESSLESIMNTMNHADAAEIDIRLTHDDVPVVYHDRTTERLSEHHNNIPINMLA